MVVKRPAAYEIPVHDARFIHKDPAAHLDVETAFGDRGDPPSSQAIRTCWNFAAVAHARDWFSLFEKPFGDPQEIGILPDVLRCAAPAEEDARVFFGADIFE